MAISSNGEEYVTFKCDSPLKPDIVKSNMPTSIDPSPKRHILGTPLFDLSSVSIRFKGDQIPISKIYGHVRLIDDMGEEFTFFDRLKSDPQYVKEAREPDVGFLQKSQLYRPCLLPTSFQLKVFLKDKFRQIVIADDQSYLDFSGPVRFDCEQELIIDKGDVAVVTVRYTVFEYALMAFVNFKVFEINKSGAESDNPCEIGAFGTISTSVQVRNGQEISHMLFDKEFEKISLFVGASNELSVVAVPTYSVLKINLSFELDNDDSFPIYSEQIVSDGLEFEPKHMIPMAITKDVVGKRWRVQIGVTWCHAFNYLDEDEFPEIDIKKLDSYRFTNRRFENPCEESSFEAAKHLLIQMPSDVKSNAMKGLPFSPSFKYGRELVEVFSIFIESKFYCPSGICEDLHGTIKCHDSNKEYLIKGKEIAKRKYKCLPLLESSCKGKATHFGMLFDLKDDKGTKISSGHLSWNARIASGWRDRRLCSVVPGKDWFVVAHYIIYSCAVVAKLKVILLSYNMCDVLKVQGNIYASCSTYKYSNCYEKKYYQSILFEKGGDGVHIGGRHGSNGFEVPLALEVPLSKDVVAVPLSASLNVGLNLRVSASGRCHKLRGEVDFNPRTSLVASEAMAVERPDYCLSVRVEWF